MNLDKIKINENECCCCGLCINILPEIFELGEYKLARVVKKLNVKKQATFNIEALEFKLNEVIKKCPCKAIRKHK